ncbi:MAG: hypothetical protein ACTHME_02405 [Candidatus Nitrosocosmicus sp.]
MSFLTITLSYNFSCTNVLANPPVFSRHEIVNTPNFGYYINLNTNVIENSQHNSSIAKEDPLGLRYIDYFSNGNTLNATLWLDNEFQSNQSSDKDFHYGMLIDADSNPMTGLDGADYQVDIYYNYTIKKWQRVLLDYSTLYGINPRTLITEINPNFYEPKQNFVLLYVNLDDISAPSKYKVMFYSYVYYTNKGNYIADFTNWVDIPPSTYSLTTSNDPLQLRPGENKTIGAQIKSTTGIIPNLVNFTIMENSLPIQAEVISDKYNYRSQSIKPITISINALSNASVGQYTIPILANISMGSIVLPKFLHTNNYSLSVPTYGYMTVPANLTVKVVEPLTFQQRFKEAWDTYGTLISLVGGGFAAGAASLLFERLKKKNESDENKEDKKKSPPSTSEKK